MVVADGAGVPAGVGVCVVGWGWLWFWGVPGVLVLDCAQAVVANARATTAAEAVIDPMRIDFIDLTSGQPDNPVKLPFAQETA